MHAFVLYQVGHEGITHTYVPNVWHWKAANRFHHLCVDEITLGVILVEHEEKLKSNPLDDATVVEEFHDGLSHHLMLEHEMSVFSQLLI